VGRPPTTAVHPETDRPMADIAYQADDQGVAAEDLRTAIRLERFFSRPGFLVRRAHQISNASFADDLGALHLTPTQMSSLVVIVDAPGIDQITLARRIGVDRTTASMVVNGLSQHGFIHCERSARDARRNEITATRAGTACIHLARDHAVRNTQKLLHAFSVAEVDRLHELLRRLVNEVRASPPEWVRPDGSSRFSRDNSDLEEAFPGHAGLYGAFGFLLRRAHQTLEAAFVECAQALSLTPRRYGVMQITSQCEPLEQIALARWLALDGSTTASVVTELVNHGYLLRTPHPADRRRRLLELADKGRTTLARAQPMAEEASQRAMEVLGDDADEFVRLMRTFLVSNDALSRGQSQRAVTLRALQALSPAS